MRAIGVSGCGAVLVEMHAKELRALKAFSSAIEEICERFPDVSCGEDGVVQIVPERSKPPAPMSQAARAARQKKPAVAGKAGDGRICAVCGKRFEGKTCAKTCSEKCRKKRETELDAARKKPAVAANRSARLGAIREADALARADMAARKMQAEDKDY